MEKNSIKCRCVEWQAVFDRAFSLIACISLRDAFIKRILRFQKILDAFLFTFSFLGTLVVFKKHRGLFFNCKVLYCDKSWDCYISAVWWQPFDDIHMQITGDRVCPYIIWHTVTKALPPFAAPWPVATLKTVLKICVRSKRCGSKPWEHFGRTA